MSEGTARATAVGIAAEALYYDIGDAYETEKTWGDLRRHVRAPYLDTVETMFKRLAERGYTIAEAGALAPTGLPLTKREWEVLECAIEHIASLLDTELAFERRRIEGQIVVLRALLDRSAPAADAATGEPS